MKKPLRILPVLVLALSLGLAMTPSAGVGAAAHTEEFTGSDTFIVPETVTKITVEAWGGGGAGGGSTTAGSGSARGGAGGGGGAYASSTLTVEPEQALQVVVGARGSGVSGASGNAGTRSFIGLDANPANALVRAAAGSGGTGNTAGGSPTGGAGGTTAASIGETRIAGANGSNGATGSGITSGAGGGGANGGGSGGAGISSGTSNGNHGNVPGGGGGGARTSRNGSNRTGGAGAAGKVVITWVTYDLTTSGRGEGSVTEPGEGTFAYGEEAVVDLVATPSEGYRFVNWTGNVGTIANVNAAATNISMNGDYSIAANFVAVYNLTAGSTDGGSVTTPGEGTFPYDCGTVVNLVAGADECYEFVNWSGDTVADPDSATTTITMDGAKSVTANFALLSYNLTVGSTDGGSVTTPGEGTFPYDCGTVVNLVAGADECYEFLNWSGDTVTDPDSATTTITMDRDCSVAANFEAMTYLTTQAASAIGTDSAVLNMSYTVGDCSSVQVSFAWKKAADATWTETSWVSKSASGSHAVTLSGLDSGTLHDFKAQLKYDTTVIAGAKLQFTTDTPPPGPCFIATAAYGTPTDARIDVLREFRDVVLLESTAGSRFVTWYYQTSPPIAEFIAENELLRTLVRELLVDPIVWLVEATGAAWRQ